MKRSFILACSTMSMLVPSVSTAHILDYMPSMPSWLSSKKEAKTLHKKYTLGKNANIIIKNLRGSVDIETNWNQEHVLLEAKIEASNKEQLEQVRIMDNAESNKPNLTITTHCEEGKNNAYVHYSLIVPANTGIHVTNQEGPIIIKQVRGKIGANTTTGDITIQGSTNTVVAHAKKHGNIQIDKPEGNLKVCTSRGRITITDSRKSVLASTHKGAIEVKASEVPPQSKIKLGNNSGTITVCLPHDVNADLQASSERGVVVCHHELTLKPRITTWDKEAWRHSKRSINGTLGSGLSQIRLHSARSNISILKESLQS